MPSQDVTDSHTVFLAIAVTKEAVSIGAEMFYPKKSAAGGNRPAVTFSKIVRPHNK